MNIIFCTIFLISTIILCFTNPQGFLNSLLNGATNSAKTALVLFSIYAVWMGISAVCEDSGINKGIAKFLRPICKKLFRTKSDVAVTNLSMNLSCNLLGLGSAATPFAIKAIDELEREGNRFAEELLFVINTTSIQLIPTTVIALRAASNSVNASDIVIPSLITTTISTVMAVTLYILYDKFKKQKMAKKLLVGCKQAVADKATRKRQRSRKKFYGGTD
jgi:spore maturation protein A